MNKDLQHPPEGNQIGGPPSTATAFQVAWLFFVICALLGVMLRMQSVYPQEWVDYPNWRHAHSHAAFLGWIFNAFFALALRHFVPVAESHSYWRLFWFLQVTNVGMLAAFPVQGYGAAGIAFTTLHMVGSAMFVFLIWKRSTARAEAQSFLRWSLVFMLLSGLGPLALGPLAAMGLRDSVWYPLSIHWYLHFQYNGWFIFFLLAVAFQWAAVRGCLVVNRMSRRACEWLAAGCVLTFALSVLWTSPPAWVHAVAIIGGLVQLAGLVYLIRALRKAADRFLEGVSWEAGFLAAVAAVSFGLKLLLQLLGGWPALASLAAHPHVLVAFLHLVFLGVATPMLLFWALREGWMRPGLLCRTGSVALLAGTLVSQVVLVWIPLTNHVGFFPPQPHRVLFAAAVLTFLGAALLSAALRRAPRSIRIKPRRETIAPFTPSRETVSAL